VNPPLRFRRRHALDAVDPAFEPQRLENILAGYPEDRFLQAAHLGGAGFKAFHFQASGFRVAVIHPVKIGGEDRGFAPASAGADFHNGVAAFVFVRRQKRDLEIALELSDAFLQIGDLIFRHRGDLDVVRRRQLSVLVELLAGSLQGLPMREQLLHAGMFPHDLAGPFPVLKKSRVRDLAFELGETLAFAFD
jgi:hypothetical protein